MELEHSFTIPVPVEQAWPILLDIRQIAPCMPGASIEDVDGDNFTGSVKVKLGPINLTYKGQAKFVEKDEKAHKAVIDARGRDSRGNGTASATITAELSGTGEATQCKVVTDLNITGKPAQFGRGVMVDVGNKLIGQFADCLADKLGADAPDETQQQTPAEARDEQTRSGSDAAPAAAAAGAAGAAHVVSPDADAKAEGGGTSQDRQPGGGAKPAQESARKPVAPTVDPAATTPRPVQPQSRPAEAEAIDLLELAGGSVAKRAIPAAAVLAALIALIVFLVKRK